MRQTRGLGPAIGTTADRLSGRIHAQPRALGHDRAAMFLDQQASGVGLQQLIDRGKGAKALHQYPAR